MHPFMVDVLRLWTEIYYREHNRLMDLNIDLLKLCARTLNVDGEFKVSSNYNIKSRSCEKLVELVKAVGGTKYLTGHRC